MAPNDCVRCCGIASVLLVVLTFFLLSPAPTSAASHYETYSTQEYRYYQSCYWYSYTYCYNWYYWNYWYWGYYWGPYYNWWYWNPYYGYWGYWPCCYARSIYECYWYSRLDTVTRTRCVSGWSGVNCDIPSCSPACSGGQTCVDINKCECLNSASGSSCSILPCSLQNNCYPGTCVSGTCKCPSGFNGTNCENILQKPDITGCKVKLYAKTSDSARETSVAEADCAAEGLEPLTAWIGKDYLNMAYGTTNLGLTKIEPVWTAEYKFPLSLPPKPTSPFFISNMPLQIGVSQATFTVNFPSLAYTSTQKPCLVENVNVDPLTSKSCDVPTPWNDLGVNSGLQSNLSFTVSMEAHLGGHKTGDGAYSYGGSTYGFASQLLKGLSAFAKARFQFDLNPPTHCLLASDDKDNCTVFPISLDQDIRTNPVIEPKFLNWTDSESGIGRYHVEVYYLQPDATDLLTEVGSALINVDITPHLNNFQFTAPRPGVYSIQLTTYDKANNSARARKIFNFNDQPSFKTMNVPVYFQEAEVKTNYSFVSRLDNRRQMTLVWTGRFQSDPLYSAVLLKRVKPWDIKTNAIDDTFNTRYGMRSINAVQNLTGISSIIYRYVIDRNGGIGVVEPKDNASWFDVDKSAQSVVVNFDDSLQDGDTIVLWLKAIDATGNPSNVEVKTFIDASRVNVTAERFQKQSTDKYTSTIFVTAVDRESGINSTNYRIYDATTKVVIRTDTIPAKKRDAPNVRKRRTLELPCTPDDTTCYCTPMRDCFPYEQPITIDHCDIDRFAGPDHRIVVIYSITNKAGVATSESEFALGDVAGLECRPQTTSGPLSGGAIAGIVIGSIIGFLIVACLIALVILMVVRVLQHKHPVPDRMRTVAHTVRNRLTMRYANRPTADNAVYVGAEPPPKYPGPSKGYGRGKAAVDTDDIYLDSDGLNANKITRKQVQMADTLAEGKFAIVRKAYLEKDTGREVVAAKALRNGFGRSDELLMSKKIAFMRDVTPHANVVRFMGAVDECGPEGPIMLLELCEMTLKDWLANIRSISTDDLEMMLVFTLNIARGVEHLHSLKIIHRRLAVRNILLKQQANGLVAKLIGFGPTAEDVNDRSDGAGAGAGAAVPIKWMAPETLDTLGSKKPTYNEKTDAWSYGVTIWEMYSKGAAPYSDVKSADVKAMIKRGHRLQCPNDCPPDLFSSVVTPCWTENPKQRPAFSAIGRTVDEFRMGSGPQEGYYAADDAHGGGGGGYGGRAPEELYADGM